MVSDDQTWFTCGAYGYTGVKTPAFDWVAANGVMFQNAFSSSPKCTASRACLLTGRNVWQNREAGTHFGIFPEDLPVYTDILEQNGYFTGIVGKGWGPGYYKGQYSRSFSPGGKMFNEIKYTDQEKPTSGIDEVNYAENFEKFLDAKSAGQPFHCLFGCHEPHAPMEKGSGHRLGKQIATRIFLIFSLSMRFPL